MVQVFVCCSDPAGHLPPCPPCETTQWLGRARPPPRDARGRRNGTAAARRLREAPPGKGRSSLEPPAKRPVKPPAGAVNPPCGFELGRWATPFRRRGGAWLTDVTPLRGLLVSDVCRFTVQAPPWAGEWVPSLALRLKAGGSGGEKGSSSDSSGSDSGSGSGDGPRGGLAVRTLPLFGGGVLDAGYNARHAPVSFATPPVSRPGLAPGDAVCADGHCQPTKRFAVPSNALRPTNSLVPARVCAARYWWRRCQATAATPATAPNSATPPTRFRSTGAAPTRSASRAPVGRGGDCSWAVQIWGKGGPCRLLASGGRRAPRPARRPLPPRAPLHPLTPLAGTAWGCASRAAEGAMPNQHGTFAYGRGEAARRAPPGGLGMAWRAWVPRPRGRPRKSIEPSPLTPHSLPATQAAGATGSRWPPGSSTSPLSWRRRRQAPARLPSAPPTPTAGRRGRRRGRRPGATPSVTR
jgi:hypothetical protein